MHEGFLPQGNCKDVCDPNTSFFSSRKIDPSGMATPIYISILKIIVFLYRYITYDKYLVVHKVSQNKINPNDIHHLYIHISMLQGAYRTMHFDQYNILYKIVNLEKYNVFSSF